MATYKGIGYDSSSGKTRTGSAADTVEFVSGVTVSRNLSVSQNASITGNLTVGGDIISSGSSNVVVQDKMIDLGIGATGAQTTGVDFITGQGTVTSPIVSVNTTTKIITTQNAVTLAAKQLIMVVQQNDPANNGIYAVKNAVTAGTSIEIDTVAYDATAPFIQTAFSGTGTVTGGTVSSLNIKVLAVAGFNTLKDSAGAWYAEGLFVEAFFTDATADDFTPDGAYQPVGATSGSDLQDAYNNGNSITTSGGKAIDFNLANGGFTVDGGTMSLGGASATNFAMDQNAATFNIGTTARVASASVKTLNGIGLDSSQAATTAAVKLAVVNGSTIGMYSDGGTNPGYNFEVGQNLINLFENLKNKGAVGTLQHLTQASGDDLKILLSGNTQSSLILESEGNAVDAITIQTVTNGGSIDINSNNDITVDAIDVISVTGNTLNLDAKAPSHLTQSATNANAQTLLIKSSNDGAGGTAGGVLELSATSVNSTGTVKVTTQSNSAAPAADRLTINELTATFVPQIVANNAVNTGIKFSSESTYVNSFIDDDTFTTGVDANSAASSESIKAYVDQYAKTVLTKQGATTITAGDVVAIDGSGEAIRADNTSAATCNVVGICIAVVSNTVYIQQTGNKSNYAGGTFASNGTKQFVDGGVNAGKLTALPPSGNGNVVFQVGFSRSATELVVVPQFIMQIG